MKSSSHEEQRRGRHPLDDSDLFVSDNLTALLDDESFLLLVFEHLVGHGLQDCRLVCRRWYEACKQFPVVLKRTTRERFQRIHTFPNATSLEIFDRDGTAPDAELFRRLASLKNLRSLAFTGGSLSHDENGQPYFQPMTGLTDLSIEYFFPDRAGDALASIKYLTNLTRLLLRCKSWRLHLDPVVELQKIQELDIDAYNLFTESGACTFPSLTNLTYLKLTDELITKAPLHPLTEVSVFADSLRQLSLRLSPQKAGHDFAPLTSLTNLGILSFDAECGRRREFVQALPQLRSVTKLQPSGYYFDMDPGLGESIARCSGLKAFYCTNSFVWIYERSDMPEVFRLTQLTELAASFSWKFLPELCCLTLLEHLNLVVEFDDDCTLDQALSSMPRLLTLGVEFTDGVWGQAERLAGRLRLSGDALSEMHHLKSLILFFVDIDETFFHALASKTGLTELDFTSSEHCSYSRDFMCQVNLLRNLENLVLLRTTEYSVGDLLSPESLSKLKRLDFSGTKDDVAAVRKRFDQSMHPVLVNRKESAWHSRSILS